MTQARYSTDEDRKVVSDVVRILRARANTRANAGRSRAAERLRQQAKALERVQLDAAKLAELAGHANDPPQPAA